MQSPTWTEDELILACALVVRNDWREYRRDDREVLELSELLRSLPLHPPEARALPEFRSPGSVSRKTTDFATNHPHYRGERTRCGEPTRRTIRAFLQRPSDMLNAADALATGIGSGELYHVPQQADEADRELYSAIEGRLLVRWATYRERDPQLRRRKMEAARRRGEALRCSVCSFDFERTYGSLGDGYIEIHHVTPLHIAGPSETRLSDLALLCANCHRMCHRSRPGESWRTPDMLRDEMNQLGR
ncbi:HNH endonuclease [Streptomyces triticagri]|uniref:HNH endonuclease n=1 Tax=Streptomyces triticagri TaxID=2293568 RepID=A0A372M204_9ACTN|nr:HNH endonuclease [Streptomyces triticagri]RFU84640.1 HNH endonuclease [Streptomyces triticagri]